MSTELNKATKITQILQRKDGSEVRIVAQAFFGEGLHRSTGVYVHRRESPNHEWVLLSDSPHPDWRSMSVEEYKTRGRSAMLQAVSIGELFLVMNLIGDPIPQFEDPKTAPQDLIPHPAQDSQTPMDSTVEVDIESAHERAPCG